MPREINALTGNYFDRQDYDLQQSVDDRMHTDLGGRRLWPDYGFPPAWPQLPRADLQKAIIDAVRTDEFADRMSFSYESGELIVDLFTDAREDY